MNNRVLVSLGTAVAASRAIQMLAHVTSDDVLSTVGLARRRSTTLENAALIGLGIVVGAGAALLLAPTNGEEARRRVGEELGKARDAGIKLVNDAKARAPELIDSARHALSETEEQAKRQHHA
jgi:hypothetical protein